MKNIFPLLAGAAIMAMVGVTGCAQSGGMSDETMYKRIPAKEHERTFPAGHTGGERCYYDEKNDVYFCSH